MISLIPLVAANVHFKGLNKFTGIDEVFLSEIKLSDLSIVSRNLFIVRSADFRWLIGNQLDSSVPLSSTNCCLNGFAEDPCLHEVLDGEVELLL